MARKVDINIHKKMRRILDKKIEILSETSRTDPNDMISLSRLKRRYNLLDREYVKLKWLLYRRSNT